MDWQNSMVSRPRELEKMLFARALAEKIEKMRELHRSEWYASKVNGTSHDQEAEIQHLQTMKEHCCTKCDRADEDAIFDRMHCGSTRLHARQVEHQANEYWKHGYPYEHPSEIIHGEQVKRHPSYETQRREAINYCLAEPEPSPLTEEM